MKYINEMEDYLYNHNYISENNNNIRQQELSIERASCIVQKYRTLTEEKDKEIERLNEELGDANYTITQLHKVMDRHYIKKEDYDRLNNIIDELEKYLEEEQDRLARECSNIYEDDLGKTRLVNEDIFNEITRIKDKLKALKEGKENDK